MVKRLRSRWFQFLSKIQGENMFKVYTRSTALAALAFRSQETLRAFGAFSITSSEKRSDLANIDINVVGGVCVCY